MPEIPIQHIVSCSSADSNNPAENLLKADGVHKWKSQLAGEKSLSVVLQFSKSSQLHSIDIGNEGSAFVEILVGKATASIDKDFEVLLVASSFMSPIESRNGTNRNSVRMFGSEKLNKMTSPQKWDRVKIVCSQPFSKTHQYGLSFIKFHSPPEGEKEKKAKIFGAFTLKSADDDEGGDIGIGSAFAKRSHNEKTAAPHNETTATPKGYVFDTRSVKELVLVILLENETIAMKLLHLSGKAAAAVRAASRLIEEKRKPSPGTSRSPDTVAQKRRAESPPLTYDNDLKSKVPKVSRDQGSDTKDGNEGSSTSVKLKKQSTSLSSVASSHSQKSDMKKSKTLPPNPSTNAAYGKIMAKVVFSLSGFENPYRGDLRNTAMEMGASYRADWGRACTHLICAFVNTPKYRHVSGKGRIVSDKWIIDCSKQRNLLSWRKYRLGNAPSPDQSSDEEEEEEIREKRPQQKQPPSSSTAGSSSNARSKKGARKYDESCSDPDTEDELRKAHEEIEEKKRLALKKKASPSANPDPYGASTDEEGNDPDTLPLSGGDNDDGSDSGLPELPDFFSDKYFFFYGEFNKDERKQLTRYIAAYDGQVEEYMTSKVNFVVTSQRWDDNFDDALLENSGLIFVKPKWILMCHEKKKYVPYQRFAVTQ